MSEIPSIKVLEAIKPINAGTGEDVLVYSGLEAAVQNYKPTNAQRSNEVWNSKQGSLEDVSKARQLALEYLLRTSEKVVESNEGNRDLWADRFTQATTELYGEPEPTEVIKLLMNEVGLLTGLKDKEGISQQHVNFLLDVYQPIIADFSVIGNIESAQAQVEQEKAAIQKYGEAIREKYQPIFDLVDEAGKTEFTFTDLQELFTKALDWLKDNDDPEWSKWEVVLVDGIILSVQASGRKIKIGTHRESASPKDTCGLLAHELLVHALRGKNGYKTGDKELATGLVGYLDAEEGLGVLAREAINNESPEKAYDDYIDIALALGTVDGIQRTRKEMFEISYARQQVRLELQGADEAVISSLAPRVWGHIDRMYRGGRGDDLGTKQAIFTRDIVYYVGYKQMAEYITSQLANGRSATEVFNYLSQAKFDPNNPQHVERVANPKT